MEKTRKQMTLPNEEYAEMTKNNPEFKDFFSSVDNEPDISIDPYAMLEEERRKEREKETEDKGFENVPGNKDDGHGSDNAGRRKKPSGSESRPSSDRAARQAGRRSSSRDEQPEGEGWEHKTSIGLRPSTMAKFRLAKLAYTQTTGRALSMESFLVEVFDEGFRRLSPKAERMFRRLETLWGDEQSETEDRD